MTKNLSTPCAECPFSRAVKPGALGGSPATTYIGQSVGPFMLPCHKACDFSDPQWKDKITEVSQCAGAALFRANVGVAPLMPAGLLRLPGNSGTVFATPAEFLSHHLSVELRAAEKILEVVSPGDMLRGELRKQQVKLLKLKDENDKH